MPAQWMDHSDRQRRVGCRRQSSFKTPTNRSVPKKEKLHVYAMKRVAADAQLPTLWLFEPAKRRDDKPDCCLDCSFLP